MAILHCPWEQMLLKCNRDLRMCSSLFQIAQILFSTVLRHRCIHSYINFWALLKESDYVLEIEAILEEESHSAWNSPIVIVVKKDGTNSGSVWTSARWIMSCLNVQTEGEWIGDSLGLGFHLLLFLYLLLVGFQQTRCSNSVLLPSTGHE